MALAFEFKEAPAPESHSAQLPDQVVLIADSSPITQQMLTAVIGAWGFKVLIASEGVEAWSILSHQTIDYVFLNADLPRLNGPSICKRIAGMAPSRRPYVIAVADGTDRTSLEASFEAGADDFIVKPFEILDLRVRMKNAAEIATLRKQRDIEEPVSDLEKLYSELSLAGEYQMSGIPQLPQTHNGLHVATRFLPCGTVSGDTLNHFPIADSGAMFYLADVAGHGVSSGLMAATINTIVQPGSCAYRIEDGAMVNVANEKIGGPAELVADLNCTFEGQSNGGLYFAMLAGFWDAASRNVRLCQAGMPYPIHVSQDGRAREIGSGGFPVGLIDDAEFDDLELTLRKGERLIVCSDGVMECHNPGGEQFGTRRLMDLIEQCHDAEPHHLLKQIEQELVAWSGRTDFGDDVSMICAECTLG